MGLALLVPAFLAGLVALAIPIWVHLRDRPYRETVEFPSLMFLERVPHRAEQRQVLRNRALLAMRALALALLALAFARPLLGGADVPTLLNAGSRDVVIVLDRSASMGLQGTWSRARAEALEVLDGLGSGDRAALVLFDDEATSLLRLTPDVGSVRAALQAAEPDHGGTRLVAGLRAATELVDPGAGATEVVLISDFQRRGWDAGGELALPEGVTLRTIPVLPAAAADNRTLAGVSAQRDPADPDLLAISARVTRGAAVAPAEVRVTLTIEGGPSESKLATVAGNGAVTVQFTPVPGLRDPVRGTVALEPDALAADDALHFVTAPGQVLRVLVLENPTSAAPGAIFLDRALAVGTRPAFSVRREPLGDLTGAELEALDLVILDDAGELDAGTARMLRRWVESGGGLLVAPGETTDRLEPSGIEAELLAAELGAPADRTLDLGGTLAFVDVSHPALEVFAAAGGAELSGARFWAYRPLRPPPAEGVLARFDDGSAALLELRHGQGRTLVWTGTFDNYWSDLPTQPAFVPLIHELAKYAGGYREPVPWLPAGRGLTARQLLAGTVADTPGGDEAGAAQAAQLRIDNAATVLPVRLSPGFHTVSTDAGTVAYVAANVDRAEGNLEYVDAEEVAAAVVRRPPDALVADESGESPARVRERRQSLWWYVLVLGFLLLAAESVLSNRLSVRAS